jgi:hypothetical protein
MTHPEVFRAELAQGTVRFSIDPRLDMWVATWVNSYGLEVERTMRLKMQPGELTDAEEKSVIDAFKDKRFV